MRKGRKTKTEEEKKHKIYVSLEPEVGREFDKYLEDTLIDKSKLVNKLIKDWLENQGRPSITINTNE